MQKLQADIEKERAKNKRCMDALRTSKEKMTTITREKANLEKELEELRAVAAGEGGDRAELEQRLQAMEADLVAAREAASKQQQQTAKQQQQQKKESQSKGISGAPTETVTASVKPTPQPQQPARKVTAVQPTRHAPQQATIREEEGSHMTSTEGGGVMSYEIMFC